MHFLRRSDRLSSFSSPLDEDILIKKILLTHDPDGRRVNTQSLLGAIENIMNYATTSKGSELHLDAIAMSNMCCEDDVSEETRGLTVYKIACEMMCNCAGDGDSHARTMSVFDLVGNYNWDAKVVLVLGAFATSYGEFWLVMQLYSLHHPLAVLLAMIKRLPNNLDAFKPRFKALRLLVKTMVDLVKYIIKFEELTLQHIKLDEKTMAITKSQIYIATYWVIRSTLACSSQIRDLVASNHQQVHSVASRTIAIWELSSLIYRLSSICDHLRKLVDMSHQQIEEKIHQKLLPLFEDMHVDNQEVLRMLFSLKDDLPLKDASTQAKVGISKLVDKEIILLVSKPDLLPLENLLLLVHQTYDHPHNHKLEGRSYDIIWVPISSSSMWTNAEVKSFTYLSNSLPWYSIRRPWLLSTAVVDYMKQVWQFKDEPLMVVLDPRGRVTNSNAIDMVLIWGAVAYPFSRSREIELWEDSDWTLKLMIDELIPLISKWVEERRTLCLYGSDELDWVREFCSKMKEIINIGVQLELIYVGRSNPSHDNVRNILNTITKEKLGGSLSYPKMQFFWLRLESIRRSKVRLGKITSDADPVLQGVESLLGLGTGEKGWAVMGHGSSTDVVKLQGRKVMECLDLFQVWGQNVEKVGFLGAMRSALEPLLLDDQCCCSNVVPYSEEGLTEGIVVCKECRRPMEKIIFYQCHVLD